MSTHPYYRRVQEEFGWSLAKRGFYLFALIYVINLIIVLSKQVASSLLTTIGVGVWLIVFTLAIYSIYEASKTIQVYVPLVGEHLYKAAYYLTLAIVSLAASIIANPLGILFLFIAFLLALASLYYLFLYASWIEQKVGPRGLAIIYVVGDTIAQLIVSFRIPLIIELVGIGLGIAANVLLGAKTGECSYKCMNIREL